MMSGNKTSDDWWLNLYDWSVGGIDFSEEGQGGLKCRDHVTFSRRVAETAVGLGVPSLAVLLWKKCSKNVVAATCLEGSSRRKIYHNKQTSYGLIRISLLVSLAFVFGIEVGYKLASRQLIWLLNPCHVTSFLQMYLLSVPSTGSQLHQTLFQFNLHFLHGPVAAMIFPVTETLHMPFEKEIYWIQHVLIIIIPCYFLLIDRTEHGYQAHAFPDWGMFFSAFLAWSFWHWVVCMWTGYLTLANVGSMLCPATSDPFAGPDYRLWGILHQAVAVGVFGILTGLLADSSSSDRPKDD